MPATSSARATTRIFGFPVQVRAGFVMFMVLIVFVNGGELGLWMAGGIAVFTLLHELGHAFAARATGAQAEIALDFLAGYASYVPTRPLARWERAGIALAGPATQIITSCAVLVAMGVNPLVRDDVGQSNATLALWWSGPVLGVLNLLPLMPLDGGNIAAAGLDRLAPGKGYRAMNVVSIPITLALLVFMATNDRLWAMAPFLAFLLVFQLQGLSASDGAAYTLGEEPPWVVAVAWLRDGKVDEARQQLVSHLTRPPQQPLTMWTLDEVAERDLEAVVALLPVPFPFGNPAAEVELVNILVRLGEYDTAARWGAEVFNRRPSSVAAILVARSAAALDQPDLTVRWLNAGVRCEGPDLVVEAIDEAPELSGLRWRPDVQAVRADAAQAAAAG
jgi:Zn-dependent protease